MIVLLAKNTVQEGKEGNFLELAQEMVRQTREEAGCISYELAQEQEDAQIFYFIEKYTDEAALERHRATAHFRTLVPQLATLRVKPSEVSVCRVVED